MFRRAKIVAPAGPANSSSVHLLKPVQTGVNADIPVIAKIEKPQAVENFAAILDGSDAVMLSAETAAGQYSVAAVALIDRIARDVEADSVIKNNSFNPPGQPRSDELLSEGIGQAACRLAENINAKAILAFTQSGSTAALVYKYRPALPIYAVTPSARVQLRLSLYAAVHSLLVHHEGNTEAQIRAVSGVAIRAGVLQPGDLTVVTMGSPSAVSCPTNLMKVHRLEAST